MRISLVLSLGLNLLVVGAVVGFFLSGGPRMQGQPSPRDTASLMTRALSADDRRAVRRDFGARLRESGPARGDNIEDFGNMLSLLRATPFDTAAFETALAEQSKRRSNRDEIGRAVLASRIAAMSPAERADYADRLEAGARELIDRQRR